MILTIDNHDGLGAVDYSAALCPSPALTIERALNKPSTCTGSLVLASTTLATPTRRSRIVVTSAAGDILFTGYLAVEPVAINVGCGLAGPVYRIDFAALSDEWLLDKQAVTSTGDGFMATVDSLLKSLTARVEPGLFSTTGIGPGPIVGVYTPETGKPWSTNAGIIAASACAGYRVVDGVISLDPVGSSLHALDYDTDLTLDPASLQLTTAKQLANDITVTGELEPTTYITELFMGDGTTTEFTLTGAPYRPTTASLRSTNPADLLTDSFDQATFNPLLWQVSDPGSHLSLGTSGLTFTGGTGSDGQTTVTAIDPVEMGGSLVLEATDVRLNAASEGMLLGLYSGAVERANCFAGYSVTTSSGQTILTAFVNGAAVGTPYPVPAGHVYTLRIRLHSPELQRASQTYFARVGGVAQAFGGGLVSAPTSFVFDLVDQGNASNTPAMVLYDSSAPTSIPVSSSPAACTFAPVDSVQLNGSLGSISITQTGTAWIVSTLPGGTTTTRLLATTGEGSDTAQGVDCKITDTGVITFFAGRIPVPGETIAITYRLHQRAVARLANITSIAAESSGGLPGTSCWIGKVVRPLARSSADCEHAAQALLAIASSRAEAASGSCTAINPTADIWPGDTLAVTTNGNATNIAVHKVKLEDAGALPEVLTYNVSFANDWATSLGITLSEAFAKDATLPLSALDTPGNAAANLQQIRILSTTATQIELDTGIDAPSGGGFEVRLRDLSFGSGFNQDLVLQTPGRDITIPRTSPVQQFYIRMYDGATPPNYSRFSSAVFTNLPIA